MSHKRALGLYGLNLFSICISYRAWVDLVGEAERLDPAPPLRKSQGVICFLRNTGMDPPQASRGSSVPHSVKYDDDLKTF